MKLKVAFTALGLACSSPPVTAPCSVHFDGTVTDDGTAPACAAVKEVSGDWTLTVDIGSSAIARLAGTIDLGPAPTISQLSSDTVTSWNVEALAATSSCAFTAGAAGVPTGSFALALDAVDTTAGTAHGTLDIVTYVHAPPLTDCGHGDIENVTLVF